MARRARILGHMQPERIEFPTEYPIKVVARDQAGLREQIEAVFTRHFGALPAGGVTERRSAQGRFTSLTFVPQVQGEQQLRDLHAELVALDGVMMVL